METIFAKTLPEPAALPPASLFRPSDIQGNNKFIDTFKTFIHHNNQIAYLIGRAGEFHYDHDHHVVIITLNALKDLRWALNNKFSESFDAPAGSVLIIPQQTDYTITLPIEAEFIQLALDDQLLASLQDIAGSLTISELFPHPSRLANPKILLIANLVRAELLKNAPVCSGYMQALLSIIMVQLVQNHSFLRTNNARPDHGGLSYQGSRRIEAYLRENYMRKLSIEKMAKILGVSGGHFLTSFRESFGQTPHQFLLMLRLNAAEEMLVGTDISLAEIADRAGFSSQSHMTTALKKCRMTTPGELRRKRLVESKKS